MLRSSAVAVAIAVALSGCDPPAKQSEPKKKPETPTSTAATTSDKAGGALSGRPPHPNMASAAWGEKVAQHLGQTVPLVDGDGAQLLKDAVTAFHQQEAGSEKRALSLALSSWKKANDDITRGAALAVAACALVVDPDVEGYADRLTDAFGLSIYAGTVDASDSTGQSCRALVGAAGGAVRQARTLIDLVAQTPKLPDEPRALLALARDATRDRSDKFFDDAKRGLTARPDSVRLRAALADHLIDLGLVDEATAALDKRSEPVLVILAARAQLDGGQPGGAVALLTPLVDKLAGVDEPRRAEAMFWRALAVLESEQPADKVEQQLAAVKEAAASLATRPGWKREASYLSALVADREGKRDEALALIAPLTKGTPRSTDAIERRMTGSHLDWCGAAKDSACVEKMAARHDVLDVDVARVAAARAAVDPALAPVAARLTSSDRAVARRLLAVRRSSAADARSQAEKTLDALLKDPELRVARALRVRYAADPNEMARFAAAALTGKGPPLADDDLAPVVDALGGFKLKESESLLALVDKDASPAIQRLVERSRAELKDPDARRKRLAAAAGKPEEGDDDGHGHGGLPGLPPAPKKKVTP